MNVEACSAVTQIIQERVSASPYSVCEIAALAGFKNPDMIKALANGDARVPLDKAMPLAVALGCDEKQVFVLVLKSWFGSEFVDTLESVFKDTPASPHEQTWITFFRDLYGDNLPELNQSLRRRLRLMAGLPG